MKTLIAFIAATYALSASAQTLTPNERNVNQKDVSGTEIEIEVIEFPGNQQPRRVFKARDGLTDEQNEKLKASEEKAHQDTQLMKQKAFEKTNQQVLEQERKRRNRGYVIREDEFFQHDDWYRDQLPKSKSWADVVGLMGFDAPVLSRRAKRIGTIKGIIAHKGEDGLYHELVTLFHSKSLGLVAVNEVSLNDPGYGPTRIWGPKIKMKVGGHRASLAVFKNKKGDKGWTQLMIISDDILSEISVSQAITQNDPRFKELVNIAEVLY